jgi:EAL domain-containing protein (putative c-di-GMP-specific phosphodiesterase class I)
VETEDQLRFLLSQGCDEFQGYLVGRPGLEEEMCRLLRNNEANAMRLRALAAPLLEKAS